MRNLSRALVGVALLGHALYATTMLHLFLLLFLPPLVEPIKDYSTSWAVEVDGGNGEADRLASLLGFYNQGPVRQRPTALADDSCLEPGMHVQYAAAKLISVLYTPRFTNLIISCSIVV